MKNQNFLSKSNFYNFIFMCLVFALLDLALSDPIGIIKNTITALIGTLAVWKVNTAFIDQNKSEVKKII